MIGKMIGAVAGAQVAKHARGVNGPAGALLGAGAVSLVRRISPVGLVAAAAGGYLIKRYIDKHQAEKTAAAPQAPAAA